MKQRIRRDGGRGVIRIARRPPFPLRLSGPEGFHRRQEGLYDEFAGRFPSFRRGDSRTSSTPSTRE